MQVLRLRSSQSARPAPLRMTLLLGVRSRTSKCKSEMRGSLHSATDDETVCCFGRDDTVVYGLWMTTADSSAALRNDKQKVRCGVTSKEDDFLLRLWNWLQWRWESWVGDGFVEGERELLLGFAVAVVGADDALD